MNKNKPRTKTMYIQAFSALLIVLTLLAGAMIYDTAFGQDASPSNGSKSLSFEKMDGFLPLYWDEDMGELWMEVPELNQEMIHYVGYGAGLGSNDLGFICYTSFLPIF